MILFKNWKLALKDEGSKPPQNTIAKTSQVQLRNIMLMPEKATNHDLPTRQMVEITVYDGY